MHSLAPLIATLIIAAATRQVLTGLAAGVGCGALLLLLSPEFNQSHSLVMESKVLMTNSGNWQILCLILLISGFVKLLETSDASTSLYQQIARYIKSERQLALSTYLSGLCLFFTDSGNSLILGPLYRPLYDNFGVCRQKLAYILDSTSSPVCILIPFIGWGVYISGLIEQTLAAIPSAANSHQSGFDYLIAALPYQYYALFTLLALPLFIQRGLNFATMAKAQKTKISENLAGHPSKFKKIYQDTHPNQKKIAGHPPILNTNLHHRKPKPGPGFVLLPIATLLLTLISCLLIYRVVWHHFAFNHIKSYLLLGYTLATSVLMTLLIVNRLMSLKQCLLSIHTGMKNIAPICIILILAWHLSKICLLLHTDQTLARLILQCKITSLLPALIFLCGALLSVSTGSSWGTFSILLPLALSIALQLNLNIPLVIGAVLSGGLFGDHCSPLSDTTILSAMGAGCTLKSHIATQFPYALIIASLTLLCYLL